MYETREDCEHEESGRCTFDYFGGNQGYCNVAGGWMADVVCGADADCGAGELTPCGRFDRRGCVDNANRCEYAGYECSEISSNNTSTATMATSAPLSTTAYTTTSFNSTVVYNGTVHSTRTTGGSTSQSTTDCMDRSARC